MKPAHLLPLTLALLGLPAAAQPAAAPRDCTLVFGQGRNVDGEDDKANKLWDDVNLSFNAAVAARLNAGGRRVVPLVAHVAAADPALVAQQVLARAAAEGCMRIVETSLFADYANRTLVARLREHPVQATEGSTTLRIGAPEYVSERNFELNQVTLDRVKPAVLADEMAGELLQRGP